MIPEDQGYYEAMNPERQPDGCLQIFIVILFAGAAAIALMGWIVL